MNKENLLFTLNRGTFPEVAVHGEIAAWQGKQSLFNFPEEPSRFPARSVLKPIQFLALDLPIELWADEKRYTACLGSTSATEDQIRQLELWYRKPELKKLTSYLALSPSVPADEASRVMIKEMGRHPSVLFHTCFSKHMGILESCEKHGWDLKSYNSVAHPYHKRLLKTLSDVLDQNCETVPVVVDGCTLPSPALPLRQIAELYQKLISSRVESALGKICRKMLADPDWIGGPKSLDSRIMNLNPDRVVAKLGADGLLALGIPPTKISDGIGIVIKIYSGFYPNLIALAVAPILEKFGLKLSYEVPKGQEVKYFYELDTWGN